MRVPLSWLNDFVKVDDIDPKELAEKLTRAGLQVETIETVGAEALSDLIVVAEVLECEAHPQSDHLHICKVTDGKETFQVVCGAPNMRKGIKTAFAKIGAAIPAFLDKNGKPEKIKKGKLRGVESFGMCCSEKELQIGEGNDGIIEYPAGTPNGALVRDLANQAKPEVVFDIEVTWNRPDALSVVGIAREYAAILGRELKLPAVDFVESDVDVNAEVKVVVEDPVKCPRYTARVVTEVADGKSPELIAKRLELCGVTPHSLCIDVTNYVLMELGQPQHAFDYKTLKDRTVVVRCAKDGETIRTLDGVERKLDATMLMICDAERPNCVAGIMGGEESGVAAGTKSLLLESALFEPTSTKYTASKLGLASESAYRYIRGVDKDLAEFASRRAMHLLQKYGQAKIAKGVIDVDNRVTQGGACDTQDGACESGQGACNIGRFNPDVVLNFDRARKLIGIPLENDRMVAILESIGLRARKAAPYAADAEVAFAIPSWRWDLSMEADLVEEIARLNGLDNIPDTMPSAPSVSSLDDSAFRAKSRIRQLLCALGFNEAMHYSFLAEKELFTKDAMLAIPDPVSAEYGVMRNSLLPQLYQSLGRNAAHETQAMLFELGKVFCLQDRGPQGKAPAEKEMLSIGFVGPVGREVLRTRVALDEEETVLWMKGVVEELVAKLHAGHLEFAAGEHPAFAPGACLKVKLNGKEIGVMGAVSAKMRHPFRLTTQMALCELETKMLLKNCDKLGRVSEVPQFPSVRRDVSLKPKAGVTDAEIVSVIRKNGGKTLVGVELFDVFKESRAYALEFRSAEKTLTDEEVGRTFNAIVDALNAISE